METGTRNLIIGVAVIAVIVVVIAAAAVGGWFAGEETETLIVTGSNTVLPIGQSCAEAYMDEHASVDVQVSGPGSSVGITSVGEGTADIGMASRPAKSSEYDQFPGLYETTIAKDGIPVIVHKDNPIDELTMDQIRAIYNGTYTNWDEVGGPDMDIVVYSRDAASGTREFFWEHVMQKDDFVSPLYEYNSHAAVKQQVSQTPGGIGYNGLGYIDSSIKVIGVKADDGSQAVMPSVATVRDGTYAISRALYMYTIGAPEGLAKDYIDFILSTDGQAIVEQEGFVSL